MKYTKAAFSYTEQLELLISRKLTCDDRDRA
jgi:abortive infection bacteriophage resistance protein